MGKIAIQMASKQMGRIFSFMPAMVGCYRHNNVTNPARQYNTLGVKQLRMRPKPPEHTIDRQLAHNEERLRLLVESVSDYAIIMLDPEGCVASWNLGAQRLNGYTEDEILGHHFSILYTPEDAASGKAEKELQTAREARRFEEEGWRVRKDGTRYWANVVLTPVEEDGTLRGYAKVVRDVTVKRELRDQEQRFKLMIDSVKDYAIFMLDPEGKVSSWNPGAERIKGYKAEEILGHHFSQFYLPEEARSGKPQRELDIAIAEGKYEEEGWRLRKDGSRFWANVVITPVRNDQGELQGFAKVTRDMTSRREIEVHLRELNSQLESFAYSVSHDLRAPLRNIAITARMLLEDAGPELSTENRELLEEQVRSASKLSQVITDLLALSRISRAEMTTSAVDLSALAHEVGDEVLSKADGNSCTFDIQKNLTGVGDRTLLRGVLLNLFENACKFSPAGGRIFFGVEVSEGQEAFVVRDEGIGFSMEYAAKIFQPFERLVNDDEFQGTGIGLANVQRAISRHGGRVWARSEPGKGASFYFTLA